MHSDLNVFIAMFHIYKMSRGLGMVYRANCGEAFIFIISMITTRV